MAESFGPYLLERRIGSGGMADVYLATGPRGVCVVKRPHPHLCDSREFVSMFLSEATLLAHLHHPGIAQIFDLGAVGTNYYLAMEYVPGFDLMSISLEFERTGELIPAAVCARIVADAAAALHYAHEATDQAGRPLSLIHRDVSPHNILLSTSGEVKLIDFGVAKAASTGNRTSAGRVKGKYPYMAPEQVTGQAIDRRIDVYALGLVLYELLTNVRAIAGESEIEQIDNARVSRIRPIEQLRPDVTDPMRLIVGSCLHPAPEGRYATALHLHQDLEKYLLFERRPVGRDDLLRLLRRMPARADQQSAEGGLYEGRATPLAKAARPPGLAAPVDDATLRALDRAALGPVADATVPPSGLAPTVPSMPRLEVPQGDATLLERAGLGGLDLSSVSTAPTVEAPRVTAAFAPALTDGALRLQRSRGPIVATLALAASLIGLVGWLVLSDGAMTAPASDGSPSNEAPRETADTGAGPATGTAPRVEAAIQETAQPTVVESSAEDSGRPEVALRTDGADESPTEGASTAGSTARPDQPAGDGGSGAVVPLATLVLDCDPPGTVSAAGVGPAPCPGTLQVPPGRHTLTLNGPKAYLRTSRVVDAPARGRKAVSLRFGRGTLKVTANPFAALRLNSVSVSDGLSIQEFSLYAGSYRLDATLRDPSLPKPIRKSVQVTVREGETTELHLNMLE